MTVKVYDDEHGLAMPRVFVLPEQILGLIKEITSLGELKVTLVLAGRATRAGLDAQGLGFSELLAETGLSRSTLTESINRALDHGIIKRLSSKYELKFDFSKKPNHMHDAMLLNHGSLVGQHGMSSVFESSVFEILNSEFGIPQRVVLDLLEKWPLQELMLRVSYTRFVRDKNGLSKSAAAYFVGSIRDQWAAPKGFSMLEQLRAEGRSDEEIYRDHLAGTVHVPEIENSVGYVLWLQRQQGRVDNDYAKDEMGTEVHDQQPDPAERPQEGETT